MYIFPLNLYVVFLLGLFFISFICIFFFFCGPCTKQISKINVGRLQFTCHIFYFFFRFSCCGIFYVSFIHLTQFFVWSPCLLWLEARFPSHLSTGSPFPSPSRLFRFFPAFPVNGRPFPHSWHWPGNGNNSKERTNTDFWLFYLTFYLSLKSPIFFLSSFCQIFGLKVEINS